MPLRRRISRHTLAIAVTATFLVAACGGDDIGGAEPPAIVAQIPAAPADPGFIDSAPVPAGVPAFVDTAATNQRGDARYASMNTNAGVRVLNGFRALWQPLTDLVDAGVSAPAAGGFPAIAPSLWTGLPNDGSPGGTALNAAVLNANVQYVVNATMQRTAAQAEAAYYDDRRGKGYSVSDGMGPLTDAWRSAARQTTSITSVPSDATTKLYSDTGNNTGVGGSANAQFGSVVDFINTMGNNGSTEPAKRFYKYARPYRWSTSVMVAPTLVPAESSAPATDGGFPSGHSAEAMRDALAMAYVLPERFQEMIGRGLELGENRILAGMHSPLDVIGGRVLAQAVVAANLVDPANTALKQAALQQAHTALYSLTNTTPATFTAIAHAGTVSNDRFSDYAAGKANYARRLTFGFAPIGTTTDGAVVPKGAEVLLETRLPYLSADQRRVVLKTTALASGSPVLDDTEGWGRLNLFAAADGYGIFTGNVSVTMDASQGGFNAIDTWRNDIGGEGKLTFAGTGMLTLAGANGYRGGTEVRGGTLAAGSTQAFGAGDVYISGGSLAIKAPARANINGQYTQMKGATLEIDRGTGDTGRLAVAGKTTLVGGTLHVRFAAGTTPKVGDVVSLIDTSRLQGRFDTVVVDGFKATALYSSSGVQIRLDA
ncbi:MULTISPECIES: phosphatase PAP2 family protein [unclassified Burkholderia]|uniref:acid phosphatase n=1 Tax=unclassified Burkholderia TaxID=2613784 RepID=UPI000F56A9A5|nr:MULTISPECIES: phosphatase PAP2 family protein [unclassified Burkholderia]RQR69839.1 phosphatase PAP2 family protein [Burkholderia sp. Bp9012]RQR73332.1 phosphatase PAP2 family protein [Burkholderia sp. Bp9011]RQR85191.1 phosphatase PAP2 family protein [Burkholderia sp. Bp9010]RQZ40315.1 phosphatase PAP2 family protein [Burkholderia sp. Bp9099]